MGGIDVKKDIGKNMQRDGMGAGPQLGPGTGEGPGGGKGVGPVIYGQATVTPQLNKPAPDFTAKTTHGEISLSDYRGKWLVLFSHPADFTPVCTSEFIAFAKMYPAFRKRNTCLLGLSIDSVYAHIGWVRNIEENFGVKIPFPIIDDLGMNIVKQYGMIQPGVSDTSAVRAVFIIDPEGILRAMIYYPLTTGRCIPEILRLIDALQVTDQYQVVTPANWTPGKTVLVPPPNTQKGAEERLESGCDCVDWYFCTVESRKK